MIRKLIVREKQLEIIKKKGTRRKKVINLFKSTGKELEKLIAKLKEYLAEVDSEDESLVARSISNMSQVFKLNVDSINFDLNSGAFATSNLYKKVQATKSSNNL